MQTLWFKFFISDKERKSSFILSNIKTYTFCAFRGEKLYVTADKRGEKGGCKRPLCWTLLGLIVAAIVALIVLAASKL